MTLTSRQRIAVVRANTRGRLAPPGLEGAALERGAAQLEALGRLETTWWRWAYRVMACVAGVLAVAALVPIVLYGSHHWYSWGQVVGWTVTTYFYATATRWQRRRRRRLERSIALNRGTAPSLSDSSSP